MGEKAELWYDGDQEKYSSSFVASKQMNAGYQKGSENQ